MGSEEMQSMRAGDRLARVRRVGLARSGVGPPWRTTAEKRKKSAPGSTLEGQLNSEAQTCYCLDGPARLPIWYLNRNMPNGGIAMSVVRS